MWSPGNMAFGAGSFLKTNAQNLRSRLKGWELRFLVQMVSVGAA
jgi:hypothetical protein